MSHNIIATAPGKKSLASHNDFVRHYSTRRYTWRPVPLNTYRRFLTDQGLRAKTFYSIPDPVYYLWNVSTCRR
jgi:hypothetical protein